MNALVIIDMQAAYFNDDNLQKQKSALIHAIQSNIDNYVSNNDIVINVKTIHSPNKETWTLNMLEDNQGFLFENTKETTTLLDLPKNVIEIHKTRDSAFHKTNLIDTLQTHNIDHIMLVGVSAHTCIFHTAADAYAYNIKVSLACSAIGDENKNAMKHSFDYLRQEYRQKLLQ